MEPLNLQFDCVNLSSMIENMCVPEPTTHRDEDEQEDLFNSKPSEGFKL